jgi:hypothetical protein
MYIRIFSAISARRYAPFDSFLRYFRVGLLANKSSLSPSSVYGSVVPNVKTSTFARNADLTELAINII